MKIHSRFCVFESGCVHLGKGQNTRKKPSACKGSLLTVKDFKKWSLKLVGCIELR